MFGTCTGIEWIDAQNVALHAAGLMKQWITDGMLSGIAASKAISLSENNN